MFLEWIQINQVRNLGSVQFSPGTGLNFLFGPNASGKTAVLESIFLLSRGRSFRTPKINDVIRHTQPGLLVSARIQDESLGQLVTGIEKRGSETWIRYQGEKVKTISEQSRAVPLVLITQDTHTLITGSPRERRHWLDWAMFHVEPEYLDIWKAYMKALRHRNALLKRGVANRDLYRAWDQAMVESGRYLASRRQRFLLEISEQLAGLMEPVFHAPVTLEMTSDWPGEMTVEQCFAQSWSSDLKGGFTRQGAHQLDVSVKLGGKSVSATCSRGQIKLFVCLLSVAQALVQARRTGKSPIILVDDYMAELDKAAGKYLLSILDSTGLQVFLTDTEEKISINFIQLKNLFHVEQGTVRQNQY